jgi:type VI secretion system protein ImpJ
MTSRAVHWHEGMFLRPHHFQIAQRHWADMAARGDKWDMHYNWGLRMVDLDLDALANYRCVVRVLQARLRDGTQLSVPEDAVLSPLELKQAFERNSSVTIYVGVPNLHLGRANVGTGNGDESRYLVDTQELEDENTGINPQPIQVRLYNVRLLLSTQDLAGYEVMPVARVEKSALAEATPQLDETYIPPVLACEAWRPLQAGVLHNIYDRIGKKIELLAEQVKARAITFDSHSQGDPQTFAQLRELNEAYAVLGMLGSAQGVHPFWAYLELCRIVGQLAIFGEARRVPGDLPHYDHDDLGGCFWRLKQHIDALLNVFVEPEYKERPFIGTGMRMQVSLEPAWLESVWDLFIGVQSPLNSEDAIRLLTKPGQLDMKIGSSDRVDAIFRLGHAGLRFSYAPHPPRVLPSLPGQIYFQINRDSSSSEWQNVQRSLTLAIRLNENLIAGNIQGQRVLTIRSGGQTTTLQFTLYVVAHE